MRAHIDHRTFEAGVVHDGHGDQQLAIEIAVVGGIVTNTGALAADGPRYLAFRAHPQRPFMPNSYPDIGWRFCQSSFALHPPRASQAIQWFAPKLGCKDMP